MALEKKDFEQIEKIVNKTESRLEKKIGATETHLEKKITSTETGLEEKIGSIKTHLEEKIEDSENRIISVLSREITDLAEINRAVIERVDQIAELEKRIIHIEHKIGITT